MKIEDVRIGDIIVYDRGWKPYNILGVVYNTRKIMNLSNGYVDLFVKILDYSGGIRYDTLSARIGSYVPVIEK